MVRTDPIRMDYLLVVDYHSDAERKRIDATIERWKSKKNVRKEKGVLIRASDDDIEAFLQDLYARLDRGSESVRMYKAEACSPDVGEVSRTLRYEAEIDQETVRQFLRYILNKLNGSYEGVRDGVESYTVYTRKGQASTGFVWADHPGKTKLTIFVSGFGDVVSFVAERIDEELKAFLGGV
ncbi:hypothetical protein [Methanocalculus sp.]|uniref:hypothetical protein n=1 Tax=Methanocalculus sp. TaxID=2004547 RepID=UPI002602346A|nr:hypothetical protein [Methanocalculus sp.]MDG6249437.1 hypothetical protein [Methanocalculus sp.]